VLSLPNDVAPREAPVWAARSVVKGVAKAARKRLGRRTRTA
jgi:hypothetical protein